MGNYNFTIVLNKLIAYFFDNYRYKSQSFWFKRLLYIFVLIKCVYWLLFYNLLFGADSIVYSTPKTIGYVKDFAFYLYNSSSISLSYLFIFGAMLCCILPFIFNLSFYIGWLKHLHNSCPIFDFILWLIIINLNNKVYPTLTAGDYLLNQFLFFNCFIAFFQSELALKKVLHNFGSLAIIIQLCLVYFLSALAKLNDHQWLNGTAIATTLQVHHYSIDFFYNIKQNMFSSIITYSVLFYQLFFPILIWFKKIKIPFLIIGVIIHLFIAFVMGLTSFGFIMILGYVYFYNFKNNLIRNIPKN